VSLEEAQETPLNNTIQGNYISPTLVMEASESVVGHIPQVIVEEVQTSPQKPRTQYICIFSLHFFICIFSLNSHYIFSIHLHLVFKLICALCHCLFLVDSCMNL
jgi:hypothetical protein